MHGDGKGLKLRGARPLVKSGNGSDYDGRKIGVGARSVQDLTPSKSITLVTKNSTTIIQQFICSFQAIGVSC